MKGFIVSACIALSAGPAFGQQDGRATHHVFPQVVDGRDGATFYRSTIYIQNVSTSQEVNTCTFNSVFALALTSAGGRTDASATHSIALPVNGWFMATTPGEQPLKRGYASLTCTDMATAQVIFSFYRSTSTGAPEKIGEAAVQSAPGGRVQQLLNDVTDGARLAVAIVNNTYATSTITVQLFDANRQNVASGTITAPPLGSGAFFLDQLFPNAAPGHYGPVIFESTTPINVTGLRFTGALFTTIPATVRVQ